MRKAFCTFGFGPYSEVLDVSRPTFERYCDLHNYDYFEEYPKAMEDLNRHPSWGKVLVMLDKLRNYDVVVWSDCDAIVANPSDDLIHFVPPEDITALVFEETPFCECPCCGFWFVRPEMIPYLEELWKIEKYDGHYWYEQRAFHEMLGYELDLRYLMSVPVRVRETELYHKTWRLSHDWNDFKFEDLNNKARIIHFPMYDAPQRAENMRRWLHGEKIATVEDRIREGRKVGA